ncbi:hypothetical protein F5Y18DRAFT_434463 [Xylariaceae sp. FL1019]|nr:hypothetical protein F5Y18DRAFT_434463 [Xylariaceae sp. FL1019]
MHSIAPLLLAFAASVAGQAWECNHLQAPNEEDCESLNTDVGITSLATQSICHDHASDCTIWYKGNCQIGLCLASIDCLTGGEMYTDYQIIKADCIDALDSGGKIYVYNQDQGANYHEWINNSNDEKLRRRGIVTEQVGNVTKASMSRAEYEALKRDLQEPSPRSMRLGRRDDTSFTLIQKATQVTNPDVKYQVSANLPAGSTYTIQKSESYTEGVTVSAEVSASFFDIIGTSLSISTTQEWSYTTTEGFEVPVDCDDGQSGVVYYYPVFNKYDGTAEPSGTFLTIWQSIDGNLGEYMVTCLG